LEKSTVSPEEHIEHFLRTGSDVSQYWEWRGDNVIEQGRNADAALRGALLDAVRKRAKSPAIPAEFVGLDLVSFTRKKLSPMVQGLFPKVEQETVLSILEKSTVFLTPENIELVLAESDYLSSAWDLANLYLGSIGAELLSEDAPTLLGFSEGTTCYVSMQYFTAEDPYEDVVVHEAAHVFHNWKRERAGLPYTRNREWLLAIDFRKRETFAYCCEAYSRLLELEPRTQTRQLHLTEVAKHPPSDERVDAEEYIDILGEAVSARNGWKRILKRCAPPKPPPLGSCVPMATLSKSGDE
jgi:hypothetical protein